jgi:hypothetical protein
MTNPELLAEQMDLVPLPSPVERTQRRPLAGLTCYA